MTGNCRLISMSFLAAVAMYLAGCDQMQVNLSSFAAPSNETEDQLPNQDGPEPGDAQNPGSGQVPGPPQPNPDPIVDPNDPLPPQDPEPDRTPEKLTWAPPALENPITLQVKADDTQTAVRMDKDKDYIVQMPSAPVRRGLAFVGGRNVVVIGGEIFIPDQGDNPGIPERRALYIVDATGVVHIEGLLMRGDDISEGIQVAAPQATVQIQNVHIADIRARDQVGFTDNHPDLIQTWGSVGALRVDKFTGSTDYQGFLLKSDREAPHGPVHIKRSNITGAPTARYLFWFAKAFSGDIHLEDFWVSVPLNRSGGLGKAVWPDRDASAAIGTDGNGNPFATWPNVTAPRVHGRVTEGSPPGGDFAPIESVGLNYQTPGYEVL